MTTPAVAEAVDVLAKRATGRVFVAGAARAEAAAALRARGLDPVEGPPAAAAFVPNAQAAGAVVPLLEAVAEALAPGAPCVVSDVMWKTAPTPELLAAFPGTRPMEGYEMQAEHAGFEVEERVDLGHAEILAAWPETRAALATDTRGAAIWRILVLRRA